MVSELTDQLTDRFTDRELQRLLVYGDILVVGVFVLGLAFLIRDTYMAGWYLGAERAGAHSNLLWAMARDAFFLLASLGWVLARFFRDQLRDLRNPWA